MITNKVNEMKMRAGLALAVLGLLAGCKTAVDAVGEFSTPKETISGGVAVATNAVTVSGAFQTGTTNVGGTVTVGK